MSFYGEGIPKRFTDFSVSEAGWKTAGCGRCMEPFRPVPELWKNGSFERLAGFSGK